MPKRRHLREPRQLLEAEVELAEVQQVGWSLSSLVVLVDLQGWVLGFMVLEEVDLWPPLWVVSLRRVEAH